MVSIVLLATTLATTSGTFGDVTFDLHVKGDAAVFDFVVDDGDPAEAIASARKMADEGKEVWRADGIEMLIGNPDAKVQFACDFLGRTYTDTAGASLDCTVKADGSRFTIRYVVPLSVLPRCADCDLESRANFLRKKRGRVLAWKPGYGPMERAGVIAYASDEERTAYRASRAESTAVREARLAVLRARHGAGHPLPRLAECETMTRVPKAWRPAKIHGKDYRFLVPSQLVSQFENFALTNSPLFEDALLWTQWDHVAPKAYQPGGSVAKLLDRYPDKAFAIRTYDASVGVLSQEERRRPEVMAFYDKAFMDSLFDRWDARFLGFVENEAFVAGPGQFRKRLDLLGRAIPVTREEAYREFEFCYRYQNDEIPAQAPFRNLANASPLARGRVSNCAAATFNQFIAAQGDVMGGNETGDCMGPQAEKFAFARGSARQHGIPWNNYQTYYSWSRVEGDDGRLSGGLRTVYAYDELISPKCRVKRYCHLNSPTWGMDRPRRKNTMFHPYFSGASVWSSEACVVELWGHFDEDEVKGVDPAVLALRDIKTMPSPLLKDHLRFWRDVVRVRDRGVQVTPIVFVWDRAHGYAPLYFYNRVWDLLPPSELEKGMWATCRHVFRCNADNSACDTSPWGDVFDMVTNDADADFLSCYRVIWPVGDVTLDEDFAANVRRAVSRGATFVVNAELLARYPLAFDGDFLGCRLTGGHGRSHSTWLVGESREVAEKYAYNYRTVAVGDSTEVLAMTTDGAEAPAVTLKRYGLGRVIVTTPANLKVPGSFTAMLSLFDELMTRLRADVLPIRVETTAEYGVAFNGTSWVFHLNNNAGATPREGRSRQPLETDVSRTADVKILVPESLGRFVESLDWWTGERKSLSREKVGGRWYRVFRTVLSGGDSALVEFLPLENSNHGFCMQKGHLE